MLSPLLFAIVVDIITEKSKRDVINEVLNADNLVLMSQTKDDLKETFGIWKALESKGLKFNVTKTNVMVSGLQGKLFKSKIDPCKVCGKRMIANSVLCPKCGNCVHGKCVKIS